MSSRRADSPPAKRVKLGSRSSSRSPSIQEISPPRIETEKLDGDADTVDEEHCSICLQPFVDRTVVPACSHEFCFECLLIWTDQSRKCPLCSQAIGDHLIHHIRSKFDYQKHYLAPLRTSPRPHSAAVAAQRDARRRARTRREHEWGRRQREAREEADVLELAIEKRRWIYRHHLFAKHVASNPYTRYRPFPTPAQFSASQDLISRATVFLRRELRVWVGLDVEFLTTFTLSLMKSLDVRSEPAVRLLAEFLDMDSGGDRVNAEHFAHELYSYLRSPYRDLARYDEIVQYDVPLDVPPPSLPQRSRRWRSRSRSASTSRSRPSSRSPVRRPSRRSRTPLPVSPHRDGRSHVPPTPSPRCPNDYPSRSRNARSRPSDPQIHADRRRSREEEGIDRSRGHSRAARSSQPMRPKGKGIASKRELSLSRSREEIVGEDSEDNGTRREFPGDIAMNDDETQDPEQHYVDADEPHYQASSNRSRTLVSPDRDPSPLVVRPAASGSQSSRLNKQHGANVRPADVPATDQLAGSTRPPPSREENVRRAASARVRSRTLLESVQAHLSLRPRSEEGLEKSGSSVSPAAPSHGAIEKFQRNEDLNAGRPSLLERLSDTVLTHSTSGSQDSIDRATSPYGDALRSPPTASSSQSASAGIKAEERRSVDEGLTLQMASTRTGAAAPLTSSSNARELLLSKLARERLLHSHTSAAMGDTARRASNRILLTRNSSDSITTEGKGGTPDGQVDDLVERSTEREARLRSQAQLRVRLAAAKKVAAAGSSSAKEDDDVAHGGGLELGGDIQSQEDVLRNALAERRRSSVAHK